MGNKHDKLALLDDQYKNVKDEDKYRMIAEFIFLENHEERREESHMRLIDVYDDLTRIHENKGRVKKFWERDLFQQKKEFFA